jgi:hypothetical protein
MRYDAESLHGEFAARFRLVESSKELHNTPFSTTQQFLYCYCWLAIFPAAAMPLLEVRQQLSPFCECA